MVIFTMGLEGRRIEDVESVLAKNGVQRVIDVRLSPASIPSRELERVAAFHGGLGRYLHIPELGSTTMRLSARKGEPIQVKALPQGLRRLTPFLDDMVWLMVGDAENPAECSRGVIAEAIAGELSGVAVRHLRKPEPIQQGALL